MRLLNKIYELVQAGRRLFNMFCDDKFEQSEADRRVFRMFDDGEMKMVVFVHLDATIERFATKLGKQF